MLTCARAAVGSTNQLRAGFTALGTDEVARGMPAALRRLHTARLAAASVQREQRREGVGSNNEY